MATTDTGATAWRSRAVCGTEYSWHRAVPGGTGTTLLALRLTRRRSGVAAKAEAAVRAVQSAHPVLCARLRGASASSPTLAFPSPAPRLALAPQPSALDFDSLLERELNSNPWASDSDPRPDGTRVLFAALYELPPPVGGAALFVRIHTAACDRAASAALMRELLAHLGSSFTGRQAPSRRTSSYMRLHALALWHWRRAAGRASSLLSSTSGSRA